MFGRKEGDGRVYFLIAIFFDLTGLAELLGKCDSKVCSFSGKLGIFSHFWSANFMIPAFLAMWKIQLSPLEDFINTLAHWV